MNRAIMNKEDISLIEKRQDASDGNREYSREYRDVRHIFIFEIICVKVPHATQSSHRRPPPRLNPPCIA